jgi:hypothetical protein
MRTIVINAALCASLGLIASLVAQQIFKYLLGLRALWLHTVTAAVFANIVFGVVFALLEGQFDPKTSYVLPRILACAVAAALAAGVPAVRFIVHGDQGDHPGWKASFAIAAVVITPGFLLLSLLHMVSS